MPLLLITHEKQYLLNFGSLSLDFNSAPSVFARFNWFCGMLLIFEVEMNPLFSSISKNSKKRFSKFSPPKIRTCLSNAIIL